MSMRNRILGVALGLLSAVIILQWMNYGSSDVAPPAGKLRSDCDGALQDIVIHYTPGGASIVMTAYRQFIQALEPNVVVHVVCPDTGAFKELVDAISPYECTMKPVPVDHPITPWSRDRWLALAKTNESGKSILVSPAKEEMAEHWTARRGDAKVGNDLAAHLPLFITSRRSHLIFDGGDFVADSEMIFVTPDVLRRNLGQTVHTREELLGRLTLELGRDITLLEESPRHHAGMFMMPVGERTVLVGDPSATLRLLGPSAADDLQPLFKQTSPDLGSEKQSQFDAVARQCREAGYTVVRMPVVPGMDERTWLTWLNVILDDRPEGKTVYMPVFDGVEVLNAEAERIWTELGWKVQRVDCTATWPNFGSLRCLVNVMRRSNK